MKDVVRDELEIKLLMALNDERAIPTGLLDVINEALTYVQNNPSISLVEYAIEELETEVNNIGKVYEESSTAHADIEAYNDVRNTLVAYRVTLLVMEELA